MKGERSPRLIILILLLFHIVASNCFSQAKPGAPQLYQEAKTLLDQENIYGAITVLRQVIAINPSYFEPLVALAEAYYFIDEYDEALRFIERAKPLGRENARLLNIQGRILLSMGKPDEAAQLFKSILKKEPYNIDALLGLAEFSVSKGDELTALSNYQKTLEYNPQDRRILLSLALLYEHQGKRKLSEENLLKALAASPESPLVQTMAAEYYHRYGKYKESEFHAMTALALGGPSPRALVVLTKTYLDQKLYDKAITAIDQIVALEPQNSMAKYLKGIAQIGVDKIPDATESLGSAIADSPQDEISRIVLENILLQNYPTTDERRTAAGIYHFDTAQQYLKKNLYSRAQFHFRRGIQLAPAHIAGRLLRGEFFKTLGQHSLFLTELQFLSKSLGVQTNYVKDNLEIYTSLLAQSVSSQWKKDQFTVPRNPLIMRVFYDPSATSLDHTGGEPYLAEYFQSQLGSSDKVSFRKPGDEFAKEVSPRTANSSDALRQARDEKSDYYVVIVFQENQEDFQLKADLYLSRTGNKIRTYQAFRTGNFRIQNAVTQVVELMQKELPLRGQLLERKVQDGLINLGSSDGLKIGDTLHIVTSDGYILQGETPGFEFSAAKKTGTFTITRLDDRVAQGTIKREGFFDKTNLGDIILRDSETALKPKDITGNFPFLYNRIRSVR